MYKVKISAGKKETAQEMLRQNPCGSKISSCGKYEFFFDDIEGADFWIVRNKYIKKPETCRVAPENTVLFISEPRSVINYPKKYRDQFAVFCSCQEGVKHKNVIYMPPLLPWFVGLISKGGKSVITLDYDTLKKMPPPAKTKLISVITSNKASTQGHQDRIQFVEKLKAHYGDKLDIFGRGFNDFDDKWDVLAPYKYHIAIENSSSKYYWTEKLSDCYLADTFPIYYGCTNVDDYFPPESLRAIDINNFDEAVKIIDKAIADNEFEKNQAALQRCKTLVLEDYNIFNRIAAVLDTLNPNLPKKEVTLKPAVSLLDWHNLYLYIIKNKLFSLKNNLKRFFKGSSSLKSR